MINREELIEVGCYNKPHGVNGEISATFDYDLELIKGVKCFISEINGIFVPFFADNIRPKSNSTLILKIDGYDSDKEVKILVNRSIYTLKKNFQPINSSVDEDDEELPIDYFIGFNIFTACDDEIGTIIDVDCSTENYLFVVEKEEQRYFIPAADDFILDLDLENKIMTMSLPEGMLSL